MVDGTGMCGGCRATVNNKTVFVCVDGPEFDAHLVDFETLARRNRTYIEDERIALDHFCNYDRAFFQGMKEKSDIDKLPVGAERRN
jgi:ferredoxin--NADP+ reductase